MWVNRIQQYEQSGLTSFKWCQENKINYQTLLYWKKKLHAPDFIEIPSQVEGIELRIGSVSLVLSENFNEKTLIRCLRAIQKC